MRIAEQLLEYLKSGVAINAVNIPAMTPERSRAVGPYLTLAERLGRFVSFIADGDPSAIRVIYTGSIAEQNTALLRNAALAGVLSRPLGRRVNAVNSMQIAADRKLTVSERHDARSGFGETRARGDRDGSGQDLGRSRGGARQARLVQVDEIPCEARSMAISRTARTLTFRA